MVTPYLFDGVTADRHYVDVKVDGDALLIRPEGHASDAATRIGASDLHIITDDAQRLTLGRADHEGWRLTFPKPEPADVRALVGRGSNYGRWIDRVGLGNASLILAGIAAAVLAVGYTAPVWLTPIIPESWEKNLGAALVGDFGDNACRSAEADKALHKMALRIDPAFAGPTAIPMTVIDYGIFNAAAIPGNQIVIFEGALADTENPDAMAGILAHEIGHVRKRHVTQALIRELGVGALIRLFAGDIGANAQQLVSLSYTRTNEEEADAEAIAALKRANIDPRPTAAMFRRLGGDDDDALTVTWLDSHPQSKDRAKKFDASYVKGHVYQPSLTTEEYELIRSVCPVPDAEHSPEEQADTQARD